MDTVKKAFIEEYLKQAFPNSTITFQEKPEPEDSAFFINPVDGKEVVLVVGGQWSMHASLADVKKVFSTVMVSEALKTCDHLNVLVGQKGIQLGKFI